MLPGQAGRRVAIASDHPQKAPIGLQLLAWRTIAPPVPRVRILASIGGYRGAAGAWHPAQAQLSRGLDPRRCFSSNRNRCEGGDPLLARNLFVVAAMSPEGLVGMRLTPARHARSRVSWARPRPYAWL